MGWEEMGYISYHLGYFPTTKVPMKLRTKGGFSSKLRIERLTE